MGEVNCANISLTETPAAEASESGSFFGAIGVVGSSLMVGIGQTALGKGLADTELSLACQAIALALDDAGIAPSAVDGLASYTLEPNREVEVARAVGLGDITFFSQVGYGGGAGCGAVGQAAMAVATGTADTLLTRVGEQVTGHEFHRTTVTPTTKGTAAWTVEGEEVGFASPTLHASYLHTHWAGHPHLAARFVAAAATYAGPDLRHHGDREATAGLVDVAVNVFDGPRDRKSTRLNSSHRT